MNQSEKKELFKKSLKEGKPEWKYFPETDNYPCPYGCIMKQRIAPPEDFVSVTDCRCPYAKNCRLNQQDGMYADAGS